MCVYIPKLHCELNPIERCWCQMVLEERGVCTKDTVTKDTVTKTWCQRCGSGSAPSQGCKKKLNLEFVDMSEITRDDNFDLDPALGRPQTARPPHPGHFPMGGKVQPHGRSPLIPVPSRTKPPNYTLTWQQLSGRNGTTRQGPGSRTTDNIVGRPWLGGT